MDCAICKEKLSPYLEGELTTDDQGQVQAHLKSCLVCSEEWVQLQQMVATLKQMPAPEPPPFFGQGVWQKVDDAQIGFWKRLTESWRISIPVGALATAAVLLLVVQVSRETVPLEQMGQPVARELRDADKKEMREGVEPETVSGQLKAFSQNRPVQVDQLAMETEEAQSTGGKVSRSEAPKNKRIRRMANGAASEKRQVVAQESAALLAEDSGLQRLQKQELDADLELADEMTNLRVFAQQEAEDVVVKTEALLVEDPVRAVQNLVELLPKLFIRDFEQTGPDQVKLTLSSELRSAFYTVMRATDNFQNPELPESLIDLFIREFPEPGTVPDTTKLSIRFIQKAQK